MCLAASTTRFINFIFSVAQLCRIILKEAHQTVSGVEISGRIFVSAGFFYICDG